MGWLFAFLCAMALALVVWRYREFLRHWRHIESIVQDLSEGREPKSFVFSKSRRFSDLAAHLERLADAQERLRRRRTQEERNLHAILGSMEEAVLVVDRRYTIRLVNPSFVRLFNLGFDPSNQAAVKTLRNEAFEEII